MSLCVNQMSGSDPFVRAQELLCELNSSFLARRTGDAYLVEMHWRTVIKEEIGFGQREIVKSQQKSRQKACKILQTGLASVPSCKGRPCN